MTVTVAYAPLSYAGNGATVDFPITWPFKDAAHVFVQSIVDATGDSTTLTAPAQYSVVGLSGAAVVRLVTAPLAGRTIKITRSTLLRQPDSLSTGGSMAPETVEGMVDRVVLQVQEVAANAGTSGGGDPSGGVTDAANISIDDTGGNYASGTVEGALAEVADRVDGLTASQVAIVDATGSFTATHVEGALDELDARIDAISSGGGATTAGAVSVADAGGYITGATVEDALQEYGASLNTKASNGIPFVTIGANALLTSERSLAVAAPLTMTDGGAGAAVTIGIDTTGLGGGSGDVTKAELADGGTAGKGAALIEYRQTGAAADRTLDARLKDEACIADFGSVVANDTFDCSAAFTAAESSAFNRIYVPEGTYYTGKASSSLTKQYVGPGALRFTDGTYARGWGYIPSGTTLYNGTGAGTDLFFSASARYCDARYMTNYGNRIGQSQPYYAPEYGMNLFYYNNQAGYSGTSARLSGALSAGATTANVASTDHLNVGDVITFTNISTGTVSEQKTITAKTLGTFSWSGGILNSYPVNSSVSRGSRTMHAAQHYEIAHGGGGDAYANLYRIYIGGSTFAGQTHFFDTKTGGIDGGDVSFSADGTYATGREVLFAGGSYDVACIGNVMSYSRNVNTGAREAVWIHDLAKSEGTKPCDAAYAVAGKWNTGLDLTRAYFGDTLFGGVQKFCAINMGADTYQYWDSSPSSTKLYPHWGENIGDTKTGYNSSTSAWEVTVDGSLVARFNPTKTVIASSSTELQGRLMATSAALHNNGLGMVGATNDFVGSATYSPTITAGDNCAAASLVGVGIYERVGRKVNVDVHVSVDPTAASAGTTVAVSLPIAADLELNTVFGVATCGEAAGLHGDVIADAGLNRAVLRFNVADTAARVWTLRFSYLVV